MRAKDVKRKPSWVKKNAYKRSARVDKTTFNQFRPCHILKNPASPLLFRAFVAISRRESNPRDKPATKSKKPGPGEGSVPIPSSIA